MRTSRRGDCIQNCAAYERCFEMACETGETSQEGALLENIMDAADKRQRKCPEPCAIIDAARDLSERHQLLGTRLAGVAVHYYQELLDAGQPAQAAQEYSAIGS